MYMYRNLHRAAARLSSDPFISSTRATRSTLNTTTTTSNKLLRRAPIAQQRLTMSTDSSKAQQTTTTATNETQATKPSEEHPQHHAQEQQEPQATQPSQTSSTLPLPAPPTDQTQQLDVSGGGGSIKLDHLGPLVVNQDGTLSRIANWEHMTEIERRNTLRVLGKRNQLRMAALKAEGQGAGEEQKKEE